MNYIFGPVASRRLGVSLGIDAIPYKTCSYDCIYCQLGRTTTKTTERSPYVPLESICRELDQYFSSEYSKPDYITFSGSGEPTLNSNLGLMIRKVKEQTNAPVAVITNGSLLFQTEVQESLKEADVVLPSLDAVTPRIFKKINRPHRLLKIERIVEGLISFTRHFDGEIWLEILLCRGINDSVNELEKLRETARSINPTKIHLNTPTRPALEATAIPLTKGELEAARRIWGEKAEIIKEIKKATHFAPPKNLEEKVLALLKRRPCSVRDISAALNVNVNEVVKCLKWLISLDKVNQVRQGRRIHYRSADLK